MFKPAEITENLFWRYKSPGEKIYNNNKKWIVDWKQSKNIRQVINILNK